MRVLEARTIIVLIGLRGSGKSSVARVVAARLGRAVVDLDDRSAAMLREATAGDAIRKHGEGAFRRAELGAMMVALHEEGTVLALGGGTPTAPGVEEMVMGARKQGTVRVVYLRANERTLRARLGADGGNRPSLTGAGMVEEIGVLLNLRDTLYKTLADVMVEVDGKSVEGVVDEVMGRV